MPTKAEVEKLILEAIREEGSLMTLGADNGVDIDTDGPQEGSFTRVEGWHRHDGGRKFFFSAKVTIELEEYSPDFGDIDEVWVYNDDEGDGDDEF